MKHDTLQNQTGLAPLGGIITAILTPVRPDLTIDTARLIAHAQNLLDAGCSKVSTFGSTGEGVAFSSVEKRLAHEALIGSGVAPSQLLPAIMSTSVTTAAAELADLAALACPHALVLPPFYYRSAGLEGLVAYFEAVFERAGRPAIDLVLYNIPAMSGITISHQLVRALQSGQGAHIAGVKDSTGDVASGLAYVEAFPELAIFTGDDRVLPHLLKAGGAGMIGGLPNLYAQDLVALFNTTDPGEAQRLAALAAGRIEEIDNQGGISALKAGLAALRNDPEWRRIMPPLGSEFRTEISQ